MRSTRPHRKTMIDTYTASHRLLQSHLDSDSGSGSELQIQIMSNHDQNVGNSYQGISSHKCDERPAQNTGRAAHSHQEDGCHASREDRVALHTRTPVHAGQAARPTQPGSTGHLIDPNSPSTRNPRPNHRRHLFTVFKYLMDTESHWENCQTVGGLHR